MCTDYTELHVYVKSHMQLVLSTLYIRDIKPNQVKMKSSSYIPLQREAYFNWFSFPHQRKHMIRQKHINIFLPCTKSRHIQIILYVYFLLFNIAKNNLQISNKGSINMAL